MEHRVTAPAVQPLGQRLVVSVRVWMLHVWACVQLALTVSPLPLCVSEIFFSSLIFADKAGAAKCFVMCEYICASVRVETEKKRESVGVKEAKVKV